MRPSNIYEYLLQRHPYLPNVLASCGADKKYTGEYASDFEKFRELCRVIINLSGNNLYQEINASVSQLFGEETQLSGGACEYLWCKYYGEGESVQGAAPTLKIKVIDAQLFSNVVNLGRINEFVKPDIYHVGLARDTCERGEALSERDSDMLKIQEIRERAEKCQNASGTLVLDARECSAEILCKTADYLDACGLLPKTAVVFDLNLDCPREILTLSKHEKISFFVFLDSSAEGLELQIEKHAQCLPIGAVTLCLPACELDRLERTMQNEIRLWKNDGRAHADCLIEFERIQTFY